MFSLWHPYFRLSRYFYDYFPIYRIKGLCDTGGMLTHDSIWQAIDRFAQSLGHSTSGLAKRAGLDPTAFNRSKRIGPDGKPRWPSTESIARVLDSTQSTMADFLSLIDAGITGPKSQAMIPVLGYTQAAQDHFFDARGLPRGDGWEMIHFPHPVDHQPVMYALEISGETFLPLFRHGDRLIISPASPIRRGDRMVVKTVNGELLVRELLRQTASKIDVVSVTPDQTSTSFPAKDIIWMARIVWVSQ